MERRPLLLIDEPSEGVQWESILLMAELIGQAKAQGHSFVVVEQNLAFAELIAERYLVIEQGRAVLKGRRGELGRERLLEHLQCRCRLGGEFDGARGTRDAATIRLSLLGVEGLRSFGLRNSGTALQRWQKFSLSAR